MHTRSVDAFPSRSQAESDQAAVGGEGGPPVAKEGLSPVFSASSSRKQIMMVSTATWHLNTFCQCIYLRVYVVPAADLCRWRPPSRTSYTDMIRVTVMKATIAQRVSGTKGTCGRRSSKSAAGITYIHR